MHALYFGQSIIHAGARFACGSWPTCLHPEQP